jgi:EmrB/QacA subfamily drug resistance transporter
MTTSAKTKPTRQYEARRWLGLAVLCTAFFMVILDVAIVNVALPSIQADLDFSAKDLQWVVSAYALTFGGLLLLGGRAADVLGRRRVFVGGIAVFALASLVGGLAWSDLALIGARALQGIGAAAMTPAALSILMTTFREGAERNKALGVWGAVGASGGTIGLLVGGVLTDTVGWEWIFLLNVPIGLFVLAAAPFVIEDSRVAARGTGFDAAGAASVTAAIALLVYTLVEAGDAGWTSARTAGLFAASAALLGAFVLIERRARSPLVPFGIFRLDAVLGSNVASLLFGGGMFGMFFVITLYLQEVLGYSPLRAGLAWLALSVPALIASVAVAQVVTRLGPKMPIAAGLTVLAGGMWWLSGISAEGAYTTDLLPALVVSGIGVGTAFVAMSIGALEGVAEHQAGLASGLINTTQQVGGALGVAVLSAIAIATTGDTLASDPTTPAPIALTEGFRVALIGGAGFAAAGAIAALLLIRARPSLKADFQGEPAASRRDGASQQAPVGSR